MPKYAVIIAAGGSGQRFGQNKQFFEIDGEPVIIRTIKKFQSGFDQIIVVTSDIDKMSEMISKYGLMVSNMVLAGKERHDSINNGLSAINPDIEYVLVHDGARLNVSKGLIDRIKQTVVEKKAVIPVIKVKDTIKLIDKDGFVEKTLDRGKLAAVQTPQAFEVNILKEAYKLERDEQITDDASLIEKSGQKVFVIEGEEDNIKLTTREDLKYF